MCIRDSYRIGMKASNNAPLQDVVRAVQYITEHAGQFGVQAEDYAIVSYSSGGQIAGLFGTDAVGYKNYGLPKPGAKMCIRDRDGGWARTAGHCSWRYPRCGSR